MPDVPAAIVSKLSHLVAEMFVFASVGCPQEGDIMEESFSKGSLVSRVELEEEAYSKQGLGGWE